MDAELIKVNTGDYGSLNTMDYLVNSALKNGYAAIVQIVHDID